MCQDKINLWVQIEFLFSKQLKFKRNTKIVLTNEINASQYVK